MLEADHEITMPDEKRCLVQKNLLVDSNQAGGPGQTIYRVRVEECREVDFRTVLRQPVSNLNLTCESDI